MKADEVLTDLNGGTKICLELHQEFPNQLKTIDPANLTEEEINLAILNVTGFTPPIFIPNRAFIVIVQDQIKALQRPAREATKKLYDILLEIIKKCFNSLSELKRFPRFFFPDFNKMSCKFWKAIFKTH